MSGPTLHPLLILYGRMARLPVAGAGLRQLTAVAKSTWSRLGARWLIRRYLATAQTPRLQLGAGGNYPPGWLNTDLQPTSWHMPRIDATRPLPFPDHSFADVFTEHMIEHITLDDARRLLREIHRVMRPGAYLRVATPDARQIARVLLDPSAPDVRAYLDWSADRLGLPVDDRLAATVVDRLYHDHGHRFLFDQPTLHAELLSAGFAEPTRCAPGQSEHPQLQRLERHDRVIGIQPNRYETLILEARRP